MEVKLGFKIEFRTPKQQGKEMNSKKISSSIRPTAVRKSDLIW